MKTLRSSVFETNSSSTHSVTIKRRGTDVTTDLVENGMLIPSRLNDYCREIGYDGRQLELDTRVKKTAWLCAVLWMMVDDYDEDEKIIRTYIDFIIANSKDVGITSIDMDNMGHYSCYGEDEDGDLQKAISSFRDHVDIDGFTKKVFAKYILNDDLIIMDEELPN